MAEQGEHLHDLVEANGLFALLEIANEPEADTGPGRELPLREAGCFSQFRDSG
jgi:hypothetical protein